MVNNLIDLFYNLIKYDTMKKYKKGDIEIVWDSGKCIHAGFCAGQLPEVFNPNVRPWIQPENASKEKIIEQVKKCPSGALSIQNSK